jgi:hypothetical protein
MFRTDRLQACYAISSASSGGILEHSAYSSRRSGSCGASVLQCLCSRSLVRWFDAAGGEESRRARRIHAVDGQGTMRSEDEGEDDDGG